MVRHRPLLAARAALRWRASMVAANARPFGWGGVCGTRPARNNQVNALLWTNDHRLSPPAGPVPRLLAQPGSSASREPLR